MTSRLRFPAPIVLGFLLLLAASCGGEATPAAESAHGRPPKADASKAEASESATSEEEAAPAASRSGCDDGTCFTCGTGSCPQGWYCDESARGGAACSWLPECNKKSECACIAKTLGSGCTCEESGGGPHVSCK